MSERERPYPDGIAWDEAWYQRQRADKLEELSVALIRDATIDDRQFVPCLLHGGDAKKLRWRILDLMVFVKGEQND